MEGTFGECLPFYFNKNRVLKIVLQIIICFLVVGLNAQTFSDVSYTVNAESIPNPERGFYHQVNGFDLETLQGFKDKGVRLILKNYSLKGFNNKALSASFITGLKQDFDIVRAAGFKMIVRFAYNFQVTTPYGDAPLDIVLLHIEQMKQVLQSNSDIILTFQAGFIGTWGEWYYTDYFSESPGVISEQNWNDRRTVVNALMDLMPKDRMVQVRTPTFKKNLAELNDWNPISESEAFNGSMKSRLAFHNDCFVASNTDYGTYNNIAIEKAYLENDSKYMIVGGETCNPSAQSNCVNSVEELERFHWTFLNLDYHQGVLNQWKDEGCWDEVATKLGFRYELMNAHLQKDAKPNGKLEFSIQLRNTGWANPSNPYTIQLNLRNTSTLEVYSYTINEDLRKWPLGETHTLNVMAGLPSGIPNGNYDLSLLIKDGRQSLAFNPSYRIQTANSGTWNEANGENELNHTISVSNQNSFPSYSGSKYFLKEGSPTAGFVGPKQMKITAFNENAIIYWSRDKQDDNQLVRLQKSTDNTNFETISINGINDISYTDKNLNPNTTYYYRTQYLLDNKYSEIASAQFTTSTSFLKQFVNIQIDSDSKDWDAVKPVASGSDNGMVALRFMNTSNNLYFMIESPTISSYEIILKSGNNGEFKISDGKLYESTNSTWAFLKDIDVTSTAKFVEGKVSLQDINFIDFTTLTGHFLINGNDIWGDDYVFQKYPSLDTPERFKVTPSVVTPLTKVKISWKHNASASGYIIERSVGDDQHFEFLKDIVGSTNYYLDKNLDSTLVYYYRMFSYKDIVRSEFTNNIRIQLNNYTSTTLIKNPIEYVNIFPNPMSDFATIELSFLERMHCDISLFDMNSIKVKQVFNGEIFGESSFLLNRNQLPKGIYLVKIQTPFLNQIRKIVIN